MEQVLRHYGILNTFIRYEDVLIGPCPIHKGKDPAQFRVSLLKNHWTCASECPHGGNPLDFIARMDRVGIHTAAFRAMAWFDLDPEAIAGDQEDQPAPSEPPVFGHAPKSVPQPEARPNPPPKPTPVSPIHPRFAEDGLTMQTILDFGVAFSEEGHITIPVHNGAGELVAQVGYSTDNNGARKFAFPSDFETSEALFNLHRAKCESEDTPLLIVESIIGCMRLHQLGHRRVVSLFPYPACPDRMSDAQEELIRQSTSRKSQVVVLFNEDEGSWSRRGELAVRLSKFVFVKVHMFVEETQTVEHLTAEDLADVLG